MMGDVYISIRGRVLINVEALNMTESVGNYVKHRRVPVMIPSDGGYTIYFVPAISGESIAHGYQVVLAEEAVKRGLPVCNLCRQGIFLKSTTKAVYKSAFSRDPPSDSFELEKSIIENCVVEDIGGFLYAEAANVKRTSCFSTGYMIPVKEAIENTVIEAQLHSRYALGTPFVKAEQRGQMIYYVELSSSVYTFSFDLETRGIGKTLFTYGKVGTEVVKDRVERIKLALDSIKKLIIEFSFGAKKTRFLPIGDWESIVIAVSDDIWTTPSPLTRDYGVRSVEKLKRISYNTKLYTYGVDVQEEDGVIKCDTLEDAVSKAIDDAKKRVE